MNPFALTAGLLILFAAISSCSNPAATTTNNTDYKRYLYLTEWTNGRVFYYDPTTRSVSSSSLVTTAPGAGEIRFYRGIGYVAVGSGTGGVYYFNPADSSPIARLLPGSASLNAEYFAFASATKAYFSTVAPLNNGTIVNSGSIYAFNPSNPNAGATQIIGLPDKYWQEIVIGSDGMLYATENLDQSVVRINPEYNTVAATFHTSQTGPTGLAVGSFDGQAGVFVANTGGSIDFVANSPFTGSATTVATYSISQFYPARMVQLPNGSLVVVGSQSSSPYNGHTYLVTVSGANVSSGEIKANNASFGGNFSIAHDGDNDLTYVPTNMYNTSNSLYVFNGAGVQKSFSPVSMAPSAGNLSNVAFYQD